MSERARKVLRIIDYGEYVAAWDPIPVTERPKWNVSRRDGEWVARPKSFIVDKFGLGGKREHWVPGNRKKGTGPKPKRAFSSESDARAHLIERGRGLDWAVYRCSMCEKFHIASPTRR